MSIEVTDSQIDEIKSLLESGERERLGELVSRLHPSDIAHLFEHIDDSQMISLFHTLKPEVASEVFLEVDERRRAILIASLTDDKLVEVVDEMDTDDATDFISELPVEEARKVLEGMDTHESQQVRRLLRYADDTAGGKMQTELVSVHEDATIEEAIEEVRRKSYVVENISSVFVVDSERVLVGVVPLDRLILAPPTALVGEIADRDFIKVTTDVDQEEVARLFKKYDLISLPVVDGFGKLVGRITVDDVVDVIEEEIFEDVYHMASLNTGERALDPPGRSFRMRSPWLLVNLGTAFLAASVVKLFEGTIESLVVLAVFMPVVAGLGGNAATQTITVMVRGLALGELSLRNARRVLVKEALVGLGNGLLVGAVAALISYLLGASTMVGVLLFLAMTANMVIAGLSGATIPLILKWLNADPALSASIFVTACTDIGGFFTFLGLAALFLHVGIL